MQRTTPTQHVVVTGLLRQRGGLIIHRSPERRWYPDAWNLPGAHVGEGEVPRAALATELQEELGITVDVVGKPFAHLQGADFRMDVWVIDQWIGVPVNAASNEHDALAWVTAHDLHGLRRPAHQIPPRPLISKAPVGRDGLDYRRAHGPVRYQKNWLS